ncbi:MAG: B12-binding domain-containing radical SAM protein [Desulfobulbaceae bacterium]
MLHFDLIALNCRYSHSCLALFYVRRELERNLPGAEVQLHQFTINDPYYATLQRLAASGADALFFSVYIWNGGYVARLVRDLARIRPDRPLVLGGPQAEVLEGLPPCCTVVQGEIEGTGEQFYRDLAANSLLSFYQAEAGHPFPSPYRESDFTEQLHNRQVYYESSRGCPFRCAYCLSSVQRGVRHKELAQVAEELAQILAFAPRIIKFVDRTFNDNPERALAIWRFLAAQSQPTIFHFEIAPDRFSEEMFAFLTELAPGRFQFEIGIQSTNPETLAAINRDMDVVAALTNISRLAALGTVHLHVDLILGLPFETSGSFRRSLNQAFALGAHQIQMGLLKVLPTTPVSRQQDAYGLIFCEQPPYEVLATRWLVQPELAELYVLGECVESFCNNRYFPTLWHYLRKNGEEPFLFFQGLAAICRQHNFFDLAVTQELLARMLEILAQGRADRELLLELLRYDWLGCGHRFLPPFLEARPLSELRAELRDTLPPSMEGGYSMRERSEFLKRGVFLELSGRAVAEIGLDRAAQAALLCFLPEVSAGSGRRPRLMILPARARREV